jgi:hypothetical protein
MFDTARPASAWNTRRKLSVCHAIMARVTDVGGDRLGRSDNLVSNEDDW